jgi:hypothetical protein
MDMQNYVQISSEKLIKKFSLIEKISKEEFLSFDENLQLDVIISIDNLDIEIWDLSLYFKDEKLKELSDRFYTMKKLFNHWYDNKYL